MDNTIPHPKNAAGLLARGSELTATVAKADNSRRRIYLLWSAILPLGMVWFDLVEPAVAGMLLAVIAVVGAIVTTVIAQRAEIVNQVKMKAYFAVMGFFAVWWLVLVGFVGPRLGEELSFGWTLTGVIGALPFLVGYVWDRGR